MESFTQNRGFSPKMMAGAVNAGDLMADMKALAERAATRLVSQEQSVPVDKSQVAVMCEAMIKVLKVAREDDMSLSEVLVLLTYIGAADRSVGDCVVHVSNQEAENITGLHLSSVKRAVSKLAHKGYMIRAQDEKVSGCTATSLVSDKGFSIFGLEGGAAISGFSLDVQKLLLKEGHDVIALVKTAWDGMEMPDEAIKGLWRGPERDLNLLQTYMANRISDAQEALMEAVELKTKRDAEEAEGVYYIGTSNGEVRVVKKVLLAFAEYSHADIKFGTETLSLLSKVKPGMVTCENASVLLAEVLYSRTYGFVVKGEYAKAQEYLVNTMRKSWSRPRSIRPYWYVATEKACSTCLSTDGSMSVH